jgi:hypothetical protein
VRDLAHGFFEQSPLMAGPLVALVLFFLVFAATAVRVLRSRASDWSADAALPLSDGPTPATRSLDGEAP